VHGSEFAIDRSAPEGEFVPAKRSVVFAINGVAQKPKSVLVRGKAISEIISLAQSQEGWAFDRTMHRLSVKTSDTQEAIAVVVR
jgi:hypothetical protein